MATASSGVIGVAPVEGSRLVTVWLVRTGAGLVSFSSRGFAWSSKPITVAVSARTTRGKNERMPIALCRSNQKPRLRRQDAHEALAQGPGTSVLWFVRQELRRYIDSRRRCRWAGPPARKVLVILQACRQRWVRRQISGKQHRRFRGARAPCRRVRRRKDGDAGGDPTPAQMQERLQLRRE